MTTRSLRFFLSLVLSVAPTLAASNMARAQDAAPTSGELVPRVCAEVDDAGLAPEARERAKHILERVLERAEMFVVDRDCSEVYRVGHETTAGRLHVRLQGPRAVVNGTAEATAQLGDVYAMMLVDQRAARAEAEARVVAAQKRAARSAAAETAAKTEPSTSSFQADELMRPVDDRKPTEGAADEPAAREGPTVASMAPIAESDPYATPPPPYVAQPEPSGPLYLRAGVGAGGAGIGGGFALGAGLRVPIDTSAAFDLSLGFVGASASAKAEVLGVSHPPSDASMPQKYRNVYGGGGLSLSVSDAGAGLGAELTGGVSFDRMFLQADLSLPFYASATNGYPAVFSTSLGLSFR